VALSAEQALDTVESDEFHGLVTDFRLPGLNGAQLIDELRRRGRGIPAVVMSAYSDDQTVAVARAAGAIAVLAKPVGIAQLLGLVAGMREGHA
jgi:CheY-like chemotaxis protein